MTAPVVLRESRVVAAPVERAFDVLLPHPLTEIFGHRYAAIPPIREVRDQDGAWGSGVGQSRTIVLADGATMREELTSLDRPRSFGYRITGVTGVMKVLVGSVEGLWSFEPAGTGVRIGWQWTVHPASRAASPAMPVFGLMWHGYARRALARVDSLLVP
ncbi:SRPBCC family protein [Nocardioides sp. MAHUQ-72]|uniref:SRPBCC family protein n=1 Tax=unclassified Nocardioides TaxID=2615069 RepID=UPI0036175055